MNVTTRRWKADVLGALALMLLSACLAGDGGYVVGGVYEDPGYEYGGWGHGYHVAPYRGGDRGERSHPSGSSPHAYRAPSPSRPTPSLPSRSRGR